jgi:hypothetical protein
MEKTITFKIPNEMWVDDFSENKTAPFNYTGAQQIWLIVNEDNSVNAFSETEPDSTTLGNKTAVMVDMGSGSNDDIAAATLIVMAAKDHTYNYADITNHDGSIYKRIENPRLNDLYTVRYNPSKGFELKPIIKDTTFTNRDIANTRKTYVEKYKQTFEFTAADQDKIDNYLSTIDTYLDTIKTAYSWKFIQPNPNEVPKIPVSLVQLFSTLPSTL